MSQAVYISDGAKVGGHRKRWASAFASLFMALFAIMGVAGLSLQGSTSSKAFGPAILCSDQNSLGGGFDQDGWKYPFAAYPQADSSNRTWTLEEVVGNNVRLPTYEGEGAAKHGWLRSVDPKRITEKSLASQTTDLGQYRSTSTCLGQAAGNSLAQAGFSLSELAVGLTQWVAVKAFDPTFICSNADQADCLNIVKIVGGDGNSSGGIIGALTNSIYMPLLVLVVAVAAGWIFYIGIIKHQVRQALWGGVWVCLSVVFGLAFLLKPAMLARAPMEVSNSLSSCVIGAFAGDNCMHNSSTSTVTPSTDSICKSDADTDASGATTLAVNSLTCSIWKAFVLEPWSQAEYGTSFEDLYTVDTNTAKVNSDVTKALQAAGHQGSDYCVSLTSTASVNSQQGILSLDGDKDKVCNLAAYQLFLQTKAQSGTDVKASDPDSRLYKLMAVIYADKDLWSKWAPTSANVAYHDQLAVVTVGATLLGCFLIAVTSVMALVYYITSAIVISLAPLFCLLMVHPSRGKKMFLGWIELLLSNILKYLASAIFVLMVIMFYAAVLGNSHSIALTIIMVAVLTGGLAAYRKEIIGLIGRANMGGQQLSNAFGQRVDRMQKKATRTALAGAGAAVGSVMASNDANALKQGWAGAKSGATSGSEWAARHRITDNKLGKLAAGAAGTMGGSLKGTASGLKDDVKQLPSVATSAASGATEGISREMKRGHGLVANSMRQSAKIKADAKTDLGREVAQLNDDLNQSKTALGSAQQNLDVAHKTMVESDNSFKGSQVRFDEIKSEEEHFQTVQMRVLTEFAQENAPMAELMGYRAQERNLRHEAAFAKASGNDDLSYELSTRASTAMQAAGELQDSYVAKVGRDKFMQDQGAYRKALGRELSREGLPSNYLTSTDTNGTSSAAYFEEGLALNTALMQNKEAHEAFNKEVNDVEEALIRTERLQSRHQFLKQAHEDVSPGHDIGPREVQRLKTEADAREASLTDTALLKKKHEEGIIKHDVKEFEWDQINTPAQDLSSFLNTQRARDGREALPLDIVKEARSSRAEAVEHEVSEEPSGRPKRQGLPQFVNPDSDVLRQAFEGTTVDLQGTRGEAFTPDYSRMPKPELRKDAPVTRTLTGGDRVDLSGARVQNTLPEASPRPQPQATPQLPDLDLPTSEKSSDTFTVSSSQKPVKRVEDAPTGSTLFQRLKDGLTGENTTSTRPTKPLTEANNVHATRSEDEQNATLPLDLSDDNEDGF